MPTFKAVVNMQRRRADDTYSVRVRVTHLRKTAYIRTPLMVEASLVTRTGRVKDVRVVRAAEDIVRRYRDFCNEHADVVAAMDVAELRRFIESHERTAARGGFRLEMVGYMRQRAAELRASGREGTAAVMERAAASLDRFCGGRGVDVNAVTRGFVAQWRGAIVEGAQRKGFKGGDGCVVVCGVFAHGV